MRYYFEKNIQAGFQMAKEKIINELKKEGFGILAQIDMQKTLKEKLGADFLPNTILEACNPPFALQSIQSEINIGIFLPCNIIVRGNDDGTTTVVVVNPVSAMQNVDNPAMDKIAVAIRAKLKNALASV